MFTTVSAAQAKARFAEFLRKAEQGEPVVITRNRRAVAALVGADSLRQLERLTAAGSQAGLAGLVGGWEGSEGLVREIERIRRSPQRRQARPEE